jgi:hypothetical protein
MKFSIFLNKSFDGNWKSDLCEKVSSLCGKVCGRDEPPHGDDSLDCWDADYDEHVLAMISNLSQDNHKISFSVDTVSVEISANDRSDLRFVAFLDEIDKLVGKSHLFYRSLTLLRAWWVYESPAYIGTNTRSTIVDEAFSTLVCALFNRYHQLIDHPIQALSIFFAEYSTLDWSKYAVTICGVIQLPSLIDSGSLQVSL